MTRLPRRQWGYSWTWRPGTAENSFLPPAVHWQDCQSCQTVILGPLLMFTPQMARAKRKGLAKYGLLAQRYVESFEQKWVLGDAETSQELLGTGDIQSLADLGNAYSVVREMRCVPFGLEDITRLAAATAAPLLPLLLTIFSPEELIMRVIKVVF